MRAEGDGESRDRHWGPSSAPQKQTEKLGKVSKHFFLSRFAKLHGTVRSTDSPTQTCNLRGGGSLGDKPSTCEIFHHLLVVSELSWMRRTPAGCPQKTRLLRKGPHTSLGHISDSCDTTSRKPCSHREKAMRTTPHLHSVCSSSWIHRKSRL